MPPAKRHWRRSVTPPKREPAAFFASRRQYEHAAPARWRLRRVGAGQRRRSHREPLDRGDSTAARTLPGVSECPSDDTRGRETVIRDVSVGERRVSRNNANNSANVENEQRCARGLWLYIFPRRSAHVSARELRPFILPYTSIPIVTADVSHPIVTADVPQNIARRRHHRRPRLRARRIESAPARRGRCIFSLPKLQAMSSAATRLHSRRSETARRPPRPQQSYGAYTRSGHGERGPVLRAGHVGISAGFRRALHLSTSELQAATSATAWPRSRVASIIGAVAHSTLRELRVNCAPISASCEAICAAGGSKSAPASVRVANSSTSRL
jgi:hypothetical protein